MYNSVMHSLISFLPERASKYALNVDTVFWVAFWLTFIAFILVVSAMLVFMLKYRAKPGDDEPGAYITHNTPLEIAWTAIPAMGVLLIFFLGLSAYKKIKYPDGVSMKVSVTARQWGWKAEYPDGNTRNGYLE